MPQALIRPDTVCAWTGPSLLVVTTRGECGPDLPLSGYYFREARFLSACRLEIDGQRLWLCEATSVDPDLLQFSYTFPEVARYGGGGSGQSGDDEPRNERGLPQRGLNVQLSYHVRIAAEPSALGVRLSVEDDGPGIDPKVRDRLFEPFVTTKEVGKGTGLGLAVCRGLVESVGGSIGLDASVTRGARFVVDLPRARPKTDEN